MSSFRSHIQIKMKRQPLNLTTAFIECVRKMVRGKRNADILRPTSDDACSAPFVDAALALKLFIIADRATNKTRTAIRVWRLPSVRAQHIPNRSSSPFRSIRWCCVWWSHRFWCLAAYTSFWSIPDSVRFIRVRHDRRQSSTRARRRLLQFLFNSGTKKTILPLYFNSNAALQPLNLMFFFFVKAEKTVSFYLGHVQWTPVNFSAWETHAIYCRCDESRAIFPFRIH